MHHDLILLNSRSSRIMVKQYTPERLKGVKDCVMDMTICPAQPEYFEQLRAIERAAFETLRRAGAVTGPAVATSLAALNDVYRHGLLLAAMTPETGAVGFVAGTFEAGWLHIAEIDVHPDWQRKGVGRRLMKTILSAGQARDLRGATLTTDNAAAFNAPFYATLGFQSLASHALPPHLARIMAEEIAAGFDPTRRTAMGIIWSPR